MSQTIEALDTTNGANRSERANEILAHAARLFFEKDYNSVGMRSIASAAGVRGATLYHHFRSKEEMLYRIVLEVTQDYIDDHLPLLDKAESHAEGLSHLVHRHVAYFWEHRHGMSVGLREMHNLTNEHFAAVQVHRLRYQRRIQEFIAAGVHSGEFSCADPNLVGIAVLDMVNGINDWFSPSGRLNIDQVANRYGSLVLIMVGAV